MATTARELLYDIDRKNPNDVQESIKRKWLLDLEKLMLHEVLETHVLSPEEERKAREIAAMEDMTDDYAVLAQPPYQEAYIQYVNAQIALLNVDTTAYENAQALYNNALLTYKNRFNRTHRTGNTVRGWRF